MQITEINPELVVAGDKVAKDIFDINNKLILPAGTIINQATLDKLHEHKITTISISQRQTINDDERKKIEQQLAKLFRNQSQDPVMQELKLALYNYLSKKPS